MIEFHISLIFDDEDQLKLQSFKKPDDSSLQFVRDKNGERVQALETQEAVRDCTVDVALNQFLDQYEKLNIHYLSGALSLKVEAYFSASDVSALNFEATPQTLRRLADLGAGFDLWAMPCE